MRSISSQRGFINIPSGTFEALFLFAALGVIALLVAFAYGLWWLFTHVSVSIAG